MQINSLKLQNFRSYEKLDLQLGQNTIIIGQNAQGKTNLLEAIYLCGVGKSYRAKEKDLVLWGEDFFRIEAETKDEKQKIEFIYEKNVGKGRKTVKINGAKRASSALMDTLKCIFFSPEEIDMFFNFPSHRRRHFNIFIAQQNPDYQRQLIRYGKVLEQRNSLLRLIREGRAKEEELEIWDGKLAEHGAEIITKRQEITTELNKSLAADYKNIAKGADSLSLSYQPATKENLSDDVWAIFLKSLVSSRKMDIASGITNVGPHRDDFKFMFAGRSLGEFASRGEFRSAILALKLSEAGILKDKTGAAPVLLLDDVFSELDAARRKLLTQNFAGQQTIVTTTDLDHIDKSLAKEALIYEVKESKTKTI